MKGGLFGRLSKWVVDRARTIQYNFFTKVAIKGQVLANFVVKFSPQIVSLELGYLESTRSEGEISVGTPALIELVLEDPEVPKEPP